MDKCTQLSELWLSCDLILSAITGAFFTRNHFKGHVLHVFVCFSCICKTHDIKHCNVFSATFFLSFFLEVWKQFHISLQTVLFPWCVFMLLHNGSVSASWAVSQCLCSRIRYLHENKGPSLFLFFLLVTASVLPWSWCSLTFLIWRWIILVCISLL